MGIGTLRNGTKQDTIYFISLRSACEFHHSTAYVYKTLYISGTSYKVALVNILVCSLTDVCIYNRFVPFRKVPIPVWVLVLCVTELRVIFII